MRTLGDLATFAVQQEASLSDCDGKRAALVQIIDRFNAAMKPKRKLWPF